MMKTARLQEIAMYLENKIRNKGFNVNYEVKNVYWDYGAGITHETIVVSDVNGDHSFQIFSPRELEDIENGKFKQKDADAIAEKHEKYFNDWKVARLN